MEIKFYPKQEFGPDGILETNKDGEVSLQMVIWHEGERKKIGIGVSVLPHLWDKEEQLVNKKNHPNSSKINNNIRRAVLFAEEAEEKLRVEKSFATVEEIAAYVKLMMKPPKKVAAVVVEEQKRDLASLHTLWKEKNTGYLSMESLRKYNQVLSQLLVFSPKATIDDIDEGFMRKYSASLTKQGKKSGTVQKHFKFVKDMRTLVGMSTKENWLKHKTQYSPQLDLTADEFLKIINVWCSTEQRSQERDMWVLQTFLGLRPGTLATLKHYHRKELNIPKYGKVQVVEIDQGKTQNPVIVPMPPLAIRIWDKYEGHFILPTQQVRGRIIKKVAEEAGLNRMYVQRDMVGNKVKESLIPVQDLIKPYTARHTAASLIYEGSEGDDTLAGWLLGHAQHGITGTTGIYAKDKASRVLPKILAAWEAILGEKEHWPG